MNAKRNWKIVGGALVLLIGLFVGVTYLFVGHAQDFVERTQEPSTEETTPSESFDEEDTLETSSSEQEIHLEIEDVHDFHVLKWMEEGEEELQLANFDGEVSESEDKAYIYFFDYSPPSYVLEEAFGLFLGMYQVDSFEFEVIDNPDQE